MNDSSYLSTLNRLGASVEHDAVADLDGRKSAVVALFPLLFRALVSRLLWPAILNVGRLVAFSLVRLVLDRLGEMTLAQLVDLVQSHNAARGRPPTSMSGFINVGKPYAGPETLFSGSDENLSFKPFNPRMDPVGDTDLFAPTDQK